jgi:hypothetical protein
VPTLRASGREVNQEMSPADIAEVLPNRRGKDLNWEVPLALEAKA